jgi:hypothetical protein
MCESVKENKNYQKNIKIYQKKIKIIKKIYTLLYNVSQRKVFKV